MREAARRTLVVMVTIGLGVAGTVGSAFGFSTGITTALFGSSGCNQCHSGGTPPDVRLLGPSTVTPGSTTEYTLEVDTVGAQNLAGLNVSVNDGTLQVGGANSSNTMLLSDEITHSSPKSPVSGTVRFSFLWQAPLTPGIATIAGWGNAVDGNGFPSNDRSNINAEELDVSVQALPATLDSYKCYQGKDLKNPKFAKLKCPAGVQTTDQITDECVDVQKVKFICTPVSVNGSALVDPSAHLICYQIKGAALSPRPKVEVVTQFQTSQFELKKPKLLCVPGTKVVLP